MQTTNKPTKILCKPLKKGDLERLKDELSRIWDFHPDYIQYDPMSDSYCVPANFRYHLFKNRERVLRGIEGHAYCNKLDLSPVVILEEIERSRLVPPYRALTTPQRLLSHVELFHGTISPFFWKAQAPLFSLYKQLGEVRPRITAEDVLESFLLDHPVGKTTAEGVKAFLKRVAASCEPARVAYSMIEPYLCKLMQSYDFSRVDIELK